MCRKLYIDHGIHISANEVLSRGSFKLEPHIRKLLDSYKDYFEAMEDTVDIYDEGYNADKINLILSKYYKENGKWYKNKKGESYYIPNNPNRYTIIIVDHVGLISGSNKKESIDDVSKRLIYYRNKCGAIPVMVSQFNRTISSSDRFKLDRVEPQLSDFKDTSATQEDANVVLALFAPYRYQIDTYRGYNINNLKGNFRGLHVLKNRDGEDNATLGLEFIGKCGHFSEYPQAKNMIYK